MLGLLVSCIGPGRGRGGGWGLLHEQVGQQGDEVISVC